MYESIDNILLKKKIIALVNNCNNADILNVLFNEYKDEKLIRSSIIHFCTCGYPLSFEQKGMINVNTESIRNISFFESLLDQETDFDTYTITYYCPNCKKQVLEQKY